MSKKTNTTRNTAKKKTTAKVAKKNTKVKTNRKATTEKKILYAHVSPANKAWIQKQAKGSGVHQGVFMDYVLNAARKNGFKITTTGTR